MNQVELPDEIEASVDELLGLAFAYLHGSISFIEKQLSNKPLHTKKASQNSGGKPCS